MNYHNEIRTHLSLDKDAPVSRAVELAGHTLCRRILGGLHHQYVRILFTTGTGEVVSKTELMTRVWPDVTVDDVSLRVHIAALRKALADARRRVRRSRIVQICLIFCAVVGSGRCCAPSAAADNFGCVGVGFVLILLVTRRISLFTLRRGAEWFVGDMMLFFVPAVVSILDHPEFIGRLGLEAGGYPLARLSVKQSCQAEYDRLTALPVLSGV